MKYGKYDNCICRFKEFPDTYKTSGTLEFGLCLRESNEIVLILPQEYSMYDIWVPENLLHATFKVIENPNPFLDPMVAEFSTPDYISITKSYQDTKVLYKITILKDDFAGKIFFLTKSLEPKAFIEVR